MKQGDVRAGRSPRWRVLAAVSVIHILAVVGLIRAFAPQFVSDVRRTVFSAFTVAAPAVYPSPSASASGPSASPPDREGEAGAEGKKSQPDERAAPRPKIAITTERAPPAAGEGPDITAGSGMQGAGSGASGAGLGAGVGEDGAGHGGGGAASGTVKIDGDINSAKDYPRASRDLRIGTSVTIEIAVGADGRPTACRVVKPSPDPDADRITCELAMRRFRFRPARDSLGNAIEATFRWRQRWFY